MWQTKFCWILLALCTFFVEPFAGKAHAKSAPVLAATEIVMPGYQRQILERDLPASDILIVDAKMWILGKRYLWRWDLNERADLKRVRIWDKRFGSHDESAKQPVLKHLGTDGHSLYAAGNDELYQVKFDTQKVLKFRLAPLLQRKPPGKKTKKRAAASLGFSGWGDHFWWVHTSGMYRIDRYGKTLIPNWSTPALKSGDRVTFDSLTGRLWVARGRKLFAAPLTQLSRPDGRTEDGADIQTKKVKKVLATKNPIRDVKLIRDGLLIQTKQSLLRLGEGGQMHQAIPVEGARHLVSMAISPARHAYLFSDGLLEVYVSASKKALKYRVPFRLNTRAKSGPRALPKVVSRGSRGVFAWLERGMPRVVRLATPSH